VYRSTWLSLLALGPAGDEQARLRVVRIRHLRCARRAPVLAALGEDLKGTLDVSALDFCATFADGEELVGEICEEVHYRGRSLSDCFSCAIVHGVAFARPLH